MRKRLKIVLAILAAVCVLGVGYATVSNRLLTINGTASATTSDNNFVVKIQTDPTVNDGYDGQVQTNVAADQQSATLNVSQFTTTGDSATVVYTIQNASLELSANVSVSITNSNEEYFTITATPSINSTTELVKSGTMTVTVVVSLKKTPTTDVSATFTITVDATPVPAS